jgi:hypothetical protein
MSPGIGPSSSDLSLRQSRKELVLIAELGHLYIGGANMTRRMSIAASAGEKPVSLGKPLRHNDVALQ